MLDVIFVAMVSLATTNTSDEASDNHRDNGGSVTDLVEVVYLPTTNEDGEDLERGRGRRGERPEEKEDDEVEEEMKDEERTGRLLSAPLYPNVSSTSSGGFIVQNEIESSILNPHPNCV